jgi:cation:H+ antiporter
LIIDGVEGFSKHIQVSTFAASALILGILTSFSELSVGINAVLEKHPEVFVGDFIGGTFIIVMFIIPILAIFHRGVSLSGHMDKRQLIYFLLFLAVPSFLISDGFVDRSDAILVILMYVVFVYMFQNREHLFRKERVRKEAPKQVLQHIIRIVVGAILVYLASHFLVEQTVALAGVFAIPPFVVSLLIVAFGTNLPELSIAASSIRRRDTGIAFGDLVGSSATNMCLFGVFTLINGPFTLAISGFTVAFYLIMLGYALFFVLARSNLKLSLYEGLALLCVYLVFVCVHLSEIFSAVIH